MTPATRIRPAAVAGRFYPGDAGALRTTVDDELVRARPWSGPVPRALIVPHAGYVYSGPIAANVYARLRPMNGRIARVVLAGPAHRVYVRGIALPEVEAFAKMANVSEEVLRVIGTNRNWLKNYGTVLGLVKNPKTPVALSINLMARLGEKDLKLLSTDRNVPDALRM